MMKHFLPLCITCAIALSCSDEEKEYAQVPFEAEYVPVAYTLGSDKTEHPVEDCANNIGDFSNDLNELISGNLLIGRIDCSDCPGYKGQYTWVSRCVQNYQYAGTWSTIDRGTTMVFGPESLPDSTIQFNAITSLSGWRLRYDIGEEYVTIRYTAKRN
ncbi:hypothetical protein WBG78_00845 [Chryseolinea sp. T2]|uniref:hypothetical protein n=1 Tax=Chryseolinea sp. T2 TaxID=3129255 RepID=UPI003076F6F5